MFRCVMILSVSFAALASGLPLAKGHDGHDHKPAPVPDFSFDPADEMVASAVWEESLWYDAQ